MAWGTKYRCEFYDNAGLDWKIDFQWDGYDEGNGITSMQASGAPLSIEPLSNGDDILKNPIRGTKADLQVMATSSFQYVAFFTLTDLEVKALIYAGGVLQFSGFVLPKTYNEPYNDTPYPVTISMIDGLGALKNIKYDDDGDPYEGRTLESQVILDILAKIGVTTFSEIINIYESRMTSATGDSPIDQIKTDVDVFDGLYCYEVLERILAKWSALIRQRAGVFYIYRPLDMIATAYMRTFTAATSKTGTSVNYIQSISRKATASDLRDVNGGTMMLIPPAKKLTINQNYGYKDSWLDNFRISQDTVTGTIAFGFTIEDWLDSGTILTGAVPVPWPDGGVTLTGRNDYPNKTRYIYQSFGDNSKTTADVLYLEIDYRILNTSGSGEIDQTFFIQIKADGADKYLYVDDGEWCEWADSEDYLEIGFNAPVGDSGWMTFARKIPGLPVDGPYTIKIFGLDDTATIYVAVKNIKFYCTADQVTIKRTIVPWDWIYSGKDPASQAMNRYWKKETGSTLATIKKTSYTSLPEIVRKQYLITNAIEGDELEIDYILGDVADTDIDNVLEQFQGSLAVVIRDTLTQTAADFVDDHDSDYPGITVEHSATTISFTENDGNDFSGNTTITNLTGNLSGSVVNTQPHSAAKPQIDLVRITGGTNGRIDITVDTVTRTCNWNTDVTTTMTTFAGNAANIAAYDAIGIDLGYEAPNGSEGGIKFTGQEAGADHTFTTSVSLFSGDMTWVIDNYQAAADAVVRIDTITLSGVNGTANILCDGVTKEIDVDSSLLYTEEWNTRGGAEADPLLELIGGEIGHQFSRSRQMLAGLPVYDRDISDNTLHVNILGPFVDDLNIDESDFDIKTVAGWTPTRCTLALTGGYATYTSTDTDSNIQKTVALTGRISKVISLRYKVIIGTPGTGTVRYHVDGVHDYSDSYKKEFTLTADSSWHTLLLDMSSLTAGGTDWIDNVIDGIRFDMTENDDVVIDLEWIGFRRFFAFNAGQYDVKNRKWTMDLVEIIR